MSALREFSFVFRPVFVFNPWVRGWVTNAVDVVYDEPFPQLPNAFFVHDEPFSLSLDLFFNPWVRGSVTNAVVFVYDEPFPQFPP